MHQSNNYFCASNLGRLLYSYVALLSHVTIPINIKTGIHEWKFFRKSRRLSPWSTVNNCTKEKTKPYYTGQY